jgi:low temperature requirement protein LtrA
MIDGHAADGHAALPVLQALTVLGLLWGLWTSFGWFSNQTRADGGQLRLGLALAMVLIFVLALAIPTALHAVGGDPLPAVLMVVCYSLVRVLHVTLLLRTAGGNAGLRQQTIRNNISLPLTIALLVFGALLGGPAQAWIWFAAAVIDAGIIAVRSRGGASRIQSASHWAERFNLVVILALGESVVSIGVGVASEPLVWQVIVGAVLAIMGAITLWWLYFHKISRGGERALAGRSGGDRLRAATIGYTYLHYLIVSGIVLTATGIEQIMHVIASAEPLGWFGGTALAGGVSLYLAGTVFFWRRMTGEWLVLRLAVATALLPGIVIAALLPAMASLVIAVVVGIALNVLEARLPRHADTGAYEMLRNPSSAPVD